MACEHLVALYQVCEKNNIKLSSSDLIHIVCTACNKQETCPSMLMEQGDDSAPATPNIKSAAKPE